MRYLSCWREKPDSYPINRCIKEKDEYCKGCVHNWKPSADFVIDESIKKVSESWWKRWNI